MSYRSIFEIISPILVIILAGFVFGRVRKIDVRPIVELVFNLTVPCLIFSSMLNTPLLQKDFFLIPAASAFIVLGCGSLALLLFKLLKVKTSPGIFLGAMFMNSGIIAFPITLSAYGPGALSKAILFDAMNGFLIFTLGVLLVVGKGRAGQILKLPAVYAIAAAVLLGPVSSHIPGILINTMGLVGDSSIPLMLLVLGLRLNSIRTSSFGPAVLASAVRLGGGLLLALAFVKMFGITGMERSVILLSGSMPSAMNSLLISEEYNTDVEIAAGALMLSTLLSFLTIPLVMHFVI